MLLKQAGVVGPQVPSNSSICTGTDTGGEPVLGDAASPGDRFEGMGLAIIQQPMRLNWTSAQRLTLANSAGSIALERLP